RGSHGAATLGGIGGNVDDTTTLALAHHHLAHEFGAQKNRRGIDGQEMLPDILPQLRDRDFIAADNRPGVVHQHINMAKVLLDLTYHRLDLLARAQVAPPPQAVPPECGDLLCHAVNTTPLPPDLSRREILGSPL